MSAPTLCILLDAFRPDYLGRTHFLKSLAARSAVGRLQEPFGFVPRAAYFGGLTPAQSGQTHMFCYNPERSPFAMAAELQQEVFAHIGLQHEAAQKITHAAKQNLPTFARAYTSALEIPWDMLPRFTPTETHAPWENAVGYQSLFHILDACGKRWTWLGWPQTQDLSDAEVVRRAMHDIEINRPEFAFIHLSALDHLGHAYGPGDARLGETIRQQDRLVETLFKVFEKNFPNGSMLIFGDHGMLPVLISYNIEAWLQDTGLQHPYDIAYFIDSTMLRVWPQHARAEQILESHKATAPHGHWLTQTDRKRLGLIAIDPSQGCDHCFVANPGVMFLPNFFQRKGGPCQGMHGYDPACADNQGIVMLYEPSCIEKREIGTIEAHQIFPLLLKLCGFAPNEFTDVACPAPKAIGKRYTACEGAQWAQAEQSIADQINFTTQAIQKIVGPTATIILGGAYGRGEGGVIRKKNGAFTGVNDYDFWVFCENYPDNAQQKLTALGSELVARFGLDFIDIGLHKGHNLSEWAPTLAHYDLKYGATVLAGNTHILDRLPDYAPADIPISEAIVLIINRVAGILLEPLDYLKCNAPWPRMLRYQLIKSTLALADAELIRWKDYTPSYRQKASRFSNLAAAADWDNDATKWILKAYAHKMDPEQDPRCWGHDLFFKLQKWTFEELRRLTSAEPDEAIPQLIDRAAMLAGSHSGTIERQWALASKKLLKIGLTCAEPNTHAPKSSVYAALLHLYRGIQIDNGIDSNSLKCAQMSLKRLLVNIPTHSADNLAQWEALRKLASQAWIALVH